MASLLLDGNPIQLSNFKPIPTTKYFYANIRVNDGVHTISCYDKIGVYVYGYGVANSYGYTGGMSMKPYDYSPPQIVTSDTCYSVKGTIADTLVSDSKISTIISPVESQVNVTVKIDNFNPFAKMVNFSAKLNNFYEDGEFELIATDSMGLYSTQKFEIPGFTLCVQNFRNGTRLPIYNRLYRIGQEFCYPVVIENYGNHNQNINDLILEKNSGFRILYNTPKTLSPGQTDTAVICFSSPVDTSFIDTLSIVGDCGIRKIQAFDLTFKGDTNQPDVQVDIDSCNKEANMIVSDSTIIDFGLATVDIIDTINCRLSREKYFPRYEKLKFTVINPYKDAIYHITATDSAGLVSDISDTIQGFTIEFPDITMNGNTLEFDSTLIGELACDSVKIRNTGLLPITFDYNMILNKNILFSFPVSQLPITIRAGDSLMMKLCFSPVLADGNLMTDTLQFEFNCLYMKIVLAGIAKPIVNNKNTKCNVPIRITKYEIPGSNFLGQNYPNPTNGFSTIRFGIADEGTANIKVYDLYGNQRMALVDERLLPGIYEVNSDFNELENGIYLYTLSADDENHTKIMVISK
jgi:hypothetical protein